MYEIVCPGFYIDSWEREGRLFTDVPGIEFERAADDGVCRLLKSERGEHDSVEFVCRCGRRFKAADGKQIELR